MGYRAPLIAVILLCASLALPSVPARAEERLHALNLYGGRMTSNHWEDFFLSSDKLDYRESYLAAVTLARTIGSIGRTVSFEVEGELVRHFHHQNHWELNALASVRWEAFYWDRTIDTSLAFGLGPSYATEKPAIEVENDGNTSRFLVYWMLELAAALPSHPQTALIARIHHRSNAFGLVADDGGSNAFAFGLKYRF